MLLVFRDTQEDALRRGGAPSRRGFGFPVQHLRGKWWCCLFEPINMDVFTGVWLYGGGGGGGGPHSFCELCVDTQEVRALSS